MRVVLLLLFLLLSAVANAGSPVKSYEPSLSIWEAGCASQVGTYPYTSSGTWTIDEGLPSEYKKVVLAWPGNWITCQDIYAKQMCPPVPPSTQWTSPDTSKPLAQQCPDVPPPGDCVAPKVKDGNGQCVDPCLVKSGKHTGKVYLELLGDTQIKASYCQGGCAVGPGTGGYSADNVVYTKLGNGIRKYYLFADFVYNGGSCDAGIANNGPVVVKTDKKPAYNSDGTNPPACPAGQTGGYKDGKPVCLKPLSGGGAGGITFGITPESNPDNKVNQDGSVTTAAGSPAAGSLSEFCNNHPSSPICTGAANDSGETGGPSPDATPGDGTEGTGSGDGTTGTGTGTTGSGTGTGTGTMNCPGCATEKTLGDIKGLLNPAGVGTGLGDGVDKAGDSFAVVTARVDATGAGTGPFSGMTWQFGSIFPASAECQPLKIDMGGRLGRNSMSVDYCATLAIVRAVLGWIVYVLTMIAVFNIATGKRPAAGGKE